MLAIGNLPVTCRATPHLKAAPFFPAIARTPSTTGMALRAFLQTPHARVPDHRLSTAELDGVMAYIRSLEAGR